MCPFQAFSFIHPFIHSFIHSFIYSFIYSFVRSFMMQSIQIAFIHSFIHSFILSFIHSFILSFIHSFIHSFIWLFVHDSKHTSVGSDPLCHNIMHYVCRCWSVLAIVPQVSSCFSYTQTHNNSLHVTSRSKEDQIVCANNLSLERFVNILFQYM